MAATLTEYQSKLLDEAESILKRIGSHDETTMGHSSRVAEYLYAFAKHKNMENSFELYIGGLVHDAGKLNVDPNIINSKNRLTDEEFIEIHKHPMCGLETVSSYPTLSTCEEAKNCAAYHHEAYAGESGYPKLKTGNGIPIEARMCAVADVFDALTSKRSYKEPWPVDKALDKMRDMDNLDPAVLNDFIKVPEIQEFKEERRAEEKQKAHETQKPNIEEQPKEVVKEPSKDAKNCEIEMKQHKEPKTRVKNPQVKFENVVHKCEQKMKEANEKKAKEPPMKQQRPNNISSHSEL